MTAARSLPPPASSPAPLTPDQRAELEHLERWPGVWIARPPSHVLDELLDAELVERVRPPAPRSTPAWVGRRRDPDDRYRVTEAGRAALAQAARRRGADALDEQTVRELGGVESW